MRERLISTDDKGRMSLGKHFAQMHFLCSENEKDGTVILKRAAVIPEKELWLHQNPEAKKSVIKGIEQAREGKGKKNAVDLDLYEVGD